MSQTTRSTTPDPSSLATPSPGDAGPRAAGRGDIRALIPALRVAARDLAVGSPLRADELVRDTIVQSLRDWDRRLIRAPMASRKDQFGRDACPEAHNSPARVA